MIDLLVALTEGASLTPELARAQARRERVAFWAVVGLALALTIVVLATR